MNSGIYTIENIITGKLYVGYACDFKTRWDSHKRMLRKNKHDNEYLQASWNKYGEENFAFDVLTECNVELLSSEEHYWCNLLKAHDSNFGYNLKSTHPEGRNITNDYVRKKLREKALGRRWSDKHKQLFREIKLGKKQSKETVRKAAEGKYKTVYQYDMNGNFVKEWRSAKHIEKELNIKASNISMCCNNVKHCLSAGSYKWSYSRY